jgi:DNA-directed RNA polymerase subunit RPC12/RpoP
MIEKQKTIADSSACIAASTLLYAGLVCPYCGNKTEYIDSSYIYNGKSYGMIYICKPCDAYVGVHKGTDKALGILANKELREAKKEAHFYFDQIAKTGLINKIWKEYIPNLGNRNKAYLWLSKQMEIDREYCHIGMFNVGQCKQVVEICRVFV